DRREGRQDAALPARRRPARGSRTHLVDAAADGRARSLLRRRHPPGAGCRRRGSRPDARVPHRGCGRRVAGAGQARSRRARGDARAARCGIHRRGRDDHAVRRGPQGQQHALRGSSRSDRDRTRGVRMDALTEVAAELYSSPLKEFVTERATRAGAAADRELAERIRALRKPSIAAWIVNVFARERTDRLAQALQLAEELREAQADLDAETLAGLGRQRRALTAQLAREAVSLAQDRGERVSASTSQAVQQTLSAAFFDPVAAAAVASGRLVRELQPSGEYAAALEEIVGGGRPEQRSSPAPRRPDEVQARRVRREAERAVIAAERELSRAQRGRQETE